MRIVPCRLFSHSLSLSLSLLLLLLTFPSCSGPARRTVRAPIRWNPPTYVADRAEAAGTKSDRPSIRRGLTLFRTRVGRQGLGGWGRQHNTTYTKGGDAQEVCKPGRAPLSPPASPARIAAGGGGVEGEAIVSKSPGLVSWVAPSTTYIVSGDFLEPAAPPPWLSICTSSGGCFCR